jgi:two-component system response regulator DevR
MVVAMNARPVDRQGGRPCVLVVDRSPIVREWVRFKLWEHGFGVIESESASDALCALERRAPDAVLVDPDELESGRDSLLAALCAAAPAGLIVLSARADAEAVNGAVRAGARGYLCKAAGRLDLAGAIRTVLDGGLALDDSALRSLVDPSQAALSPPSAELSRQELRVVELVAHGLTNREIGARLSLSPHTVKGYLRNAADKLGATTRLDAVLEASRRGLIELPAPPRARRGGAVRRHARGALLTLANVWLMVDEPLALFGIA